MTASRYDRYRTFLGHSARLASACKGHQFQGKSFLTLLAGIQLQNAAVSSGAPGPVSVARLGQ